MNITINGENTILDSPSISIEKLLELRRFKKVGTAVAVNNKLVLKASWSVHQIQEGDSVTVISAAFGG